MPTLQEGLNMGVYEHIAAHESEGYNASEFLREVTECLCPITGEVYSAVAIYFKVKRK